MTSISATDIDAESVTKVTSFGSQFSTAANATKVLTTPQEAVGQANTAPSMDLTAVSETLATIQESLNESAEEAMLPSAPINTPVGPSPEPSVVGCNKPRNNVFGEFGDRIAEVLFDSRNRRVSDDSVSNQSVRSFDPSVDDSEDDTGSSSGSDKSDDSDTDKKEVCSIPICLGSPKLNPLIHEYIAFTPTDLPAEDGLKPATEPTVAKSTVNEPTVSEPTVAEPAVAEPAVAEPTVAETTVPKVSPPLVALAPRPESSASEGGVTENSNWADECEDGMKRALSRLEQLVKDEVNEDDYFGQQERYIVRLTQLLESKNRKFPITIEAKPKIGHA